MTFMKTLKTMAAAASFVTFGSVAQAAVVAEITAEGRYQVVDINGVGAVDIAGGFTAFADTNFDTSATNDFKFELDLKAEGLRSVDEELFVPGITGNDIIGFSLLLGVEIENLFPGAIDAVVGEVLDGDLAQTEIISDIWLGFDFDITGGSANMIEGFFNILLSGSEVDILATRTVAESGAFSGSARISTVAAVPLPASLPLLLLGAAGLMALRRRRTA